MTAGRRLMQRTWKCILCGYLHEGENPPDKCPMCGANKYQFLLYEKLPDSLEKLVKEAFAGEAKASARNAAFAAAAERDNLPQIARLFHAVADAERVHAAEYLKYLEGIIRDTETNLQTAFENEIKAKNDIYPPFIKQALESKREDLAGSFARARDVEEQHAALYKGALSALMQEENVPYYVCQICGNVFAGNLPDLCPVCSATKENFKEF
jgi:rubrerythrin